jgi:hypothetical protein
MSDMFWFCSIVLRHMLSSEFLVFLSFSGNLLMDAYYVSLTWSKSNSELLSPLIGSSCSLDQVLQSSSWNSWSLPWTYIVWRLDMDLRVMYTYFLRPPSSPVFFFPLWDFFSHLPVTVVVLNSMLWYHKSVDIGFLILFTLHQVVCQMLSEGKHRNTSHPGAVGSHL